MKLLDIIGADISKSTIDLFCYGLNSYVQISNDVTGFKKLQLWLKKLQLDTGHVAIVMEHTGFYSYHFENFLHLQAIRFSKVPALVIKRSLGLVRGKTDKVDAERIAAYGYEKRDKLHFEKPADPQLHRLQILLGTRARLIKERASCLCAIKAYAIFLSKNDSIILGQMRVVKTLTREIKAIEQEMKKLVSESTFKENFQLLISIKGVGIMVATTTLVKTKNFTVFKNGRKFSCYCGSAPFDHSSGSSIRKKTRISHLADKTMK